MRSLCSVVVVMANLYNGQTSRCTTEESCECSPKKIHGVCLAWENEGDCGRGTQRVLFTMTLPFANSTIFMWDRPTSARKKNRPYAFIYFHNNRMMVMEAVKSEQSQFTPKYVIPEEQLNGSNMVLQGV